MVGNSNCHDHASGSDGPFDELMGSRYLRESDSFCDGEAGPALLEGSSEIPRSGDLRFFREVVATKEIDADVFED